MYELGKCNKGYYIEQLNSILKQRNSKKKKVQISLTSYLLI